MAPEDSKSFNLSAALRFGSEKLSEVSSTPQLDAQLLLSHVLGLNRLELILDAKEPVNPQDFERFSQYLERRARKEPVAYITGRKEFWGISFEVSPAVLIPRPDTELMVDLALTFAASFPDPLLVCDLGTGSGCIPVSLAFELKRRSRNFYIVACDKSADALRIARSNAIQQGCQDDIGFVCSDWDSALQHEFDLVLSNPPYLMSEDPEISPELHYEPQAALYAGEDGLDCYRKIIARLPNLLSKKGVFLGEIGYGQAQSLADLVKLLIPDALIEFHYDLRRIQRVIEIRLS